MNVSTDTGGPVPSRAPRSRDGLGVCVVTGVTDVTPRMRRITFRGEGLRLAVATGPDQRVKLSFPQGRTFTGDAAELSVSRRKRRTYTLLHLDTEAGTAVVDFVLHPGGVAGQWAQNARPGDELMLTAPVGGFEVPADADEVVLVADETGLPALQAIAAQLPADVPARAFVEVADAAEHQPVPSPAALDLTWLNRDGADHGSLITGLAHTLPGTVTPESVVWIAGEAAAVRELRTALITEAGLHRHRIDAVAYWTTSR